MPIINDKYEQAKIDRLKHFLGKAAEKGNAKYYEIFVDSLKVVEKTNDPEEFENYEDFVNEDTQKIKILIYNSPHSPRNDQYNFSMREVKSEGLNGTDVNRMVSEALEGERKENLIRSLKEDNQKLSTKVNEAEAYIEKLEKTLDLERSNKYKIGNINVGELASVALEGIIRRNPKMLTMLPGGEALAGIIEADNKDKEKAINQPEASESEATFKRKSQEANTDPEDEERLLVLKMIQSNFSEQEIKHVWEILQKLSEDNGLIPIVLEFINEEEQEEKPENNDSHEEIQL